MGRAVSETIENGALAPHRKPPLARLGRKLTVAGGPARNAHERRLATPWADPRLCERDGFLDEFAAMFSANWERPNGAVIIEGASWTGRTAVLGAARRLAVESGMSVLYARGSDLERGNAWGVVRQLFTPQFPSSAAEVNGSRGEAHCEATLDEPVAAGPYGPHDWTASSAALKSPFGTSRRPVPFSWQWTTHTLQILNPANGCSTLRGVWGTAGPTWSSRQGYPSTAR